jgi:hypothetical protein
VSPAHPRNRGLALLRAVNIECGTDSLLPGSSRACRFAIFGMDKDMFLTNHAEEIAASGLDPGGLFETHDEDDNDRLSKIEYTAALKKFQTEL